MTRLAREGGRELVAHGSELLLHVRGQLVVVLLDALQDVRLPYLFGCEINTRGKRKGSPLT